MKTKKEFCYFCDKKKICKIEDIGGRVSADNKVSVCLSCSKKDKIRQEKDNEIEKLNEKKIKELEALSKFLGKEVLKWNV